MTIIRTPVETDFNALFKVVRTTFVEAFGMLYAPEDLHSFLDGTCGDAALRKEVDDPQHYWLIAVAENAEILGYIQACPVSLPHADADPKHQGEIKRLYVTQAAQGSGLGTRLLQLGLEALAQTYGIAPQWIGVYSDNDGAQKLYQRHGFTKVGDYHFKVGSTLDAEFILRRLP
jgi:diamine N-acetyltransferase